MGLREFFLRGSTSGNLVEVNSDKEVLSDSRIKGATSGNRAEVTAANELLTSSKIDQTSVNNQVVVKGGTGNLANVTANNDLQTVSKIDQTSTNNQVVIKGGAGNTANVNASNEVLANSKITGDTSGNTVEVTDINRLKTETLSNGIVSIINGDVFSHITSNNNGTATLDITFTTPVSGFYIMSFGVNSSERQDFLLLEAVTASGGTTVTPINHERNSGGSSPFNLQDGATITVTGTTLYSIQLGADLQGNNTSGGGGSTSPFVLKQNTKYGLRFQNGASANNVSTWGLEFFAKNDII